MAEFEKEDKNQIKNENKCTQKTQTKKAIKYLRYLIFQRSSLCLFPKLKNKFDPTYDKIININFKLRDIFSILDEKLDRFNHSPK